MSSVWLETKSISAVGLNPPDNDLVLLTRSLVTVGFNPAIAIDLGSKLISSFVVFEQFKAGVNNKAYINISNFYLSYSEVSK